MFLLGPILDSVLCQPAPAPSAITSTTLPQQIKNDNHSATSSSSSSSGSSPIMNKSFSSQQHHLLFSPPNSNAINALSATTGPRAVIPSKRAAQNRAAQRAFRQRKERYVKDLEKKTKLMDEWKLELDQLRQQNKELRENTMRLEKQIHQQVYGDNKLISPITSTTTLQDEIVIPPPVVVVMDNNTTTKSSRRKIKQVQQHPQKIQTSFLPVNLRAPDQTTQFGSPTTSCSSSSSSINGLDDSNQYQQLSWPANNDFEYDFMNNTSQQGGQVLDNLCAVLQTRQRPEISYNMQQQQQQSYVMSLNSSSSSPNNNSNMLMSRPY
jgi:hypothetical protein